MKPVRVTTRGHVRCCGVPMRRTVTDHGTLLACRMCKRPGPEPDADLYVGRLGVLSIRWKHPVAPHPLMAPKGTVCTGLRCRRPECRKRRKERLRKAWKIKETARRAEWDALTSEERTARLSQMFKSVFGDSVINRFPNMTRIVALFRTPEQRQADWMERQAARERKWADLPKVTIQDDRWRLEVEARARRYVTPNELAERYRLAMAASEEWEKGIQEFEREVSEAMR